MKSFDKTGFWVKKGDRRRFPLDDDLCEWLPEKLQHLEYADRMQRLKAFKEKRLKLLASFREC